MSEKFIDFLELSDGERQPNRVSTSCESRMTLLREARTSFGLLRSIVTHWKSLCRSIGSFLTSSGFLSASKGPSRSSSTAVHCVFSMSARDERG